MAVYAGKNDFVGQIFCGYQRNCFYVCRREKKTCLSVIDEDQNYSAKKKIGPALPAGPRCVFQCHPAFVNKNGKLSAKKSNLSAKSTLSGKKRRYLYNSDHFLKNKLISDFFVGLFPLVKFFLLDFKSLIL